MATYAIGIVKDVEPDHLATEVISQRYPHVSRTESP